MKRILSLVLVLALVLGSVPVAFAAEETAGEKLKAAGFVAGDQDGNLMEDQKLTREQMMVLIAQMYGVQ
jgi:Spy/CpxP family protein refolding chaperone